MIDLTYSTAAKLQPAHAMQMLKAWHGIGVAGSYMLNKSLSLAAAGLDAHLGLKAHVKHAVSLIKDQVGDSLACAGFHLDKINHPARGTHSDLQFYHIRCIFRQSQSGEEIMVTGVY